MNTHTPRLGLAGAYLIHWTKQRAGDAAVFSATRVESEAELIGFLLGLPGDGTFVVRAVTEL